MESISYLRQIEALYWFYICYLRMLFFNITIIYMHSYMQKSTVSLQPIPSSLVVNSFSKPESQWSAFPCNSLRVFCISSYFWLIELSEDKVMVATSLILLSLLLFSLPVWSLLINTRLCLSYWTEVSLDTKFSHFGLFVFLLEQIAISGLFWLFLLCECLWIWLVLFIRLINFKILRLLKRLLLLLLNWLWLRLIFFIDDIGRWVPFWSCRASMTNSLVFLKFIAYLRTCKFTLASKCFQKSVELLLLSFLSLIWLLLGIFGKIECWDCEAWKGALMKSIRVKVSCFDGIITIASNMRLWVIESPCILNLRRGFFLWLIMKMNRWPTCITFSSWSFQIFPHDNIICLAQLSLF